MKRSLFIVIIFGLSILIAACSSNSESSEIADNVTINTEEKVVENNSQFAEAGDAAKTQEGTNSQQKNAEIKNAVPANRKVIYTANLRIEVKDYQKTVTDIQNKVADFSGYIVDSSMHTNEEDGITEGQITARIPQDKFRDFIDLVEEGSKVLNSSISGQDVTEEYVDLESRLESKRMVEKRLLSFMEQAEKTEDLLQISEDLAKVQEEIEQITGRMKYLQNKVDLATVTIQIQENSVSIAGMDKDDLNTWEKIKNQFLKSINFLISLLSGLLVFFVGNLPVLIILGVIALIVWWIVRKRKIKNKDDE